MDQPPMKRENVHRFVERALSGKIEGESLLRLRHPSAWADLPDTQRIQLSQLFLPLQPGEVLLVAADEGPWAGLMTEQGESLRAEVGECWERAERLAVRKIPIILDVDAVQHPKMRRLLKLVGENRRPPEGRSFGLGLALGRMSEILDTPIPADVAASATLEADGSLGSIQGLPEKIHTLQLWYPGIQRLLIHPENLEEAGRLAPELRLKPVSTLKEAIQEVFPEAVGPQAGWASTQWEQHVEKCFSLAFFDYGAFQGWAALKESLRRRPPLQGLLEWKALATEGIADRKEGGEGRIPEAPEKLRRPLRLKLLAQQVQGANDRVEADWEVLAKKAEDALASVEEETEWELRLCGALGRLYLAWGRHPEAEALLWRSLLGWEALYQPEQSSFSLCALLMQAAQEGKEAKELLKRGEGLLRMPRCDRVSRAYISLAMSRVSWKNGGPSYIDHIGKWEQKPVGLQAARLRWLCAQGKLPDRELASLALRHPTQAGEQHRLLRLFRGEDPGRLIAEDAAFGKELERRYQVEPGASVGRVFECWPH